MAWRDAAWFGTTVVIVMLSLAVPPTLSMALLCLLGMFASAVDKALSMMRPEPRLPIIASAPAVVAPALAPAVVASPAAVALALAPPAAVAPALAPAVVAPPVVVAPALAPPAVVAPALAPPAVVAPALAPPAVVVPALAPAVVAPPVVVAPALAPPVVVAPALAPPAVVAPALAPPAVVVPALAPAVVAAGRKPESSSTSPSSSKFKYDVYLNFRGRDTRYGIADHLYRQLDDAGVKVFSDSYDLTPGEEIGLEIKKAIKRSRISIAIFSKNFASSRWCLSELVHMWGCRERKGQTIIPIFYDVNPEDVGLRTEIFSEALNKLEQKLKFRRSIDSNTIETWREVLRQIAELQGFTRCTNQKGHEGQLVKKVVERVVQLLEDYQLVKDKLVGIDHNVQEMMRKLGVAYREGQAIEVQGEEARVVGICGAQGVGKTTLAEVVFNKICKLFDACSFLEDIRSEGVQFSRHMLIADLKKHMPAPLGSSSEETEEIASLCRDAKVLIVLDGVDKEEQIKALAGKLTWFGPGSRIILTTNKRDVLKAFDVGTVEEHTVKPMDQVHAHKLFCKHAFQGDAAQDVSDYFGLSTSIAKAIGGLPSDIVRQASSLREDMNMVRWKTTLDLLQKKHKK